MTERSYVIGVRALCEFTAKRGDLDLRFTPSPTAQEGVAGHRVVASRRSSSASQYRAELSLRGDHGSLSVRGRADGYDAAANLLEEVKTHRGDLARQPANHRDLHWAQAKVYGALLCRQLDLVDIRLALVYFDVGSQTETSFVERHTAADLHRFFEAQCVCFLAWSEHELAHAAARDASLTALPFPHAAFRAGQRELAEGAYRAAMQSRCLVAQAPTGIGKTIATIFPLLKAWPRQAIDKIFFLTAKGSGRRLALQALDRLQQHTPALRLRTVELVARDKACEHPDKACHGESCPLARGFFDRLPAARQAAFANGLLLDQAGVRAVALDHTICPYYLGQELVRWADVVVGDYNHYFDGSALLHGLALAHEWHVVLLVDEAHNLLERARSMYSGRLDRAELQALRHAAPAAVRPSLDRLDRRWAELQRGEHEPHRVLSALPAPFATALQQASAALADHFAENPNAVDGALLTFHFDVLQFMRLLDTFDNAHSMLDVTLEAPSPKARTSRPNAVLGLRNVVPAPHLRQRFEAAATTVLFSATLTPMHFHRDTLGLPTDAVWLDVPSPFAAEQLSLRVARHVSTRWRDREGSVAPIVALMARQFSELPGNYLAFFSSYEYLDRVFDEFGAGHPAVPVWLQSRGMAAVDRDAFLARFTEHGCGIGFAVLGGSFGEAIDLPGKRLVGAFVASLGMPPPGPVNEQMKRRIDAAFGAGYDYTYLFPGIQKVVQAVGRVIRTPADSGVVHLIDDRFDRAEVRRLFPRWWKVDGGSNGRVVLDARTGSAGEHAAGDDAPALAAQPMQVRFLPVRLAS